MFPVPVLVSAKPSFQCGKYSCDSGLSPEPLPAAVSATGRSNHIAAKSPVVHRVSDIWESPSGAAAPVPGKIFAPANHCPLPPRPSTPTGLHRIRCQYNPKGKHPGRFFVGTENASEFRLLSSPQRLLEALEGFVFPRPLFSSSNSS